MKRTYKLIASRGNEIVFDDRIQSDTPRNARNELKKLLGPSKPERHRLFHHRNPRGPDPRDR